MAQGQVAAVSRVVGPVLLYVPVVHPHEFDVAISYLVRRLEENASTSNFLSAAFHLAEDPPLFERERLRFVDSVRRAGDHSLLIGARRVQNRSAPLNESVRPQRQTSARDEDLTGIVLGIARGTDADGDGDPFLQTAVYSRQELAGSASGAPGFANIADSDPSLAANREWAREVFARIADPEASVLGLATLKAARIDDERMLSQTVARVREAASAWGTRPASERSEVLLRAAAALAERRADLIEIAAIETGKVFAEADIEVSEAVDFARYYAATCRELDGVAGARF